MQSVVNNVCTKRKNGDGIEKRKIKLSCACLGIVSSEHAHRYQNVYVSHHNNETPMSPALNPQRTQQPLVLARPVL